MRQSSGRRAGFSARRWRMTNRTSVTAATSSRPSTSVRMLATGAKLIARTKEPTSTTDRMPPRLSTFSLVSLTCEGKNFHAMKRATNATGSTTKKTEFQGKRSNSRPGKQGTGCADGAADGGPQRNRSACAPRPAPIAPQSGPASWDRPYQRRSRQRAGRRSALRLSGQSRRSTQRELPGQRQGSRSACGRSGHPARRARAPSRPDPASRRRRQG